MQKKQTYNLIWFRNDLRTHDNESIAKAVRRGKPILAFYCYDKRQFSTDTFGFKKTERFRAKFLIETVNALQRNLSVHNILLIVKFGYTELEIQNITKEYTIDTIFYQSEWTKEELDIENQLRKKLPSVHFENSYTQFLLQPSSVLTVFKNKIPNSFTTFRKKVENELSIRKKIIYNITTNSQLPSVVFSSNNINLKTLGFDVFKVDARTAFPCKGGEDEALDRLMDYVFGTKKVAFYKQTRNGLTGVNYSTKFSPWLANGSLSAVTIYEAIKEYEANYGSSSSTYWVIFELLWRDFFKFIAMKYNNLIFCSGGIQRNHKKLLHNKSLIQQWIQGKTSCDFVNANMIELKQTGWMSNRGRQNVASYFTKERCQDWRIGASYFESMLIDYDVHSNYGNWMYVAGVGNDRRNRKFNTALQANKYDAKGAFRKQWLQMQLL